jgi:EmrB/QacA subfamily drug resistance transporter
MFVHADRMTNRARLIIMSGVMLALFLSAIDQTVVATAMPRIVADLGGLAYYSWVFTSYLLTSTAAFPVFGKLSDLYGRRNFMLGGILLFLLTSALCGLANSMPLLIFLRGIQGIGGGIMMINAFSIVGDIFPPAERGKWQGLTASSFALASVVGPAIGGFLTDNLSWRWIFYVNLPIGAVALVVIFFTLPAHAGSGMRYKIDYFGVAALLAALIPLLLAFVWAGDLFPWFSRPFLALLLLAALCTAGFIGIERRASEPILPLHLFRNGIFTAGNAIMFMSGMAIFGASVYIPLYMIAVRGTSATGAGITTIPMTVTMPITSTLAGFVISKTGRYKLQIILGAVVMVIGYFLLSKMTLDTSTAAIIRNTVIVGFGTGFMMPIVTIAVQNAVPYEVLGTATSAIQFFRSIGQTIGVAIFGSILVTRLAVEIPKHLTPDLTAPLSPQAVSLIHSPQTWLDPILPPQLEQELAHATSGGQSLLVAVPEALRGAFASSLQDVFVVGALLCVLVVLTTLTLRELPLRRTNLDQILAASQGEGFVPEPIEPSLALAGEEAAD